MENRLSEESVKSVLDAGHTHTNWIAEEISGLLAGYDLKMVLTSPEAKNIIQSMPVQSLYFSLKRQGVEELLPVLPLMSQEQVLRIFDYDVWHKDQLSTQRVFKWLRLFGEVEPHELYKRFRGLDEEYQLEILRGKFRLITREELDDEPQEVQDCAYALPCQMVFYQIFSEDEFEIETINRLIEAFLAEDIPYTYSLLGLAAEQIPNEGTCLLSQFRNARLEEDGFVTYEESQGVFLPADLSSYLQKYSLDREWIKTQSDSASQLACCDTESGSRYRFFYQVLERSRQEGWDVEDQYAVLQSLLHLTNKVAAACRVEPDDIEGLNRVMQQIQAMVSLGLEFLANHDETLGVKILKNEHCQILFKVGIALIDFVREGVVTKLEQSGFHQAKKIREWLKLRKWGLILAKIDGDYREFLGFETAEILKGLFSRFPMYPLFQGNTQEKSARQKIVFELVDSMESFKTILTIIDSITGTLHLMQKFAHAKFEAPLEKLMATSLLLAAATDVFSLRAVKTADLDAVMSMSEDEFSFFRQSVNEQFYLKLADEFDLWSIGKGYSDVERSTHAVLGLVQEMLVGLDFARSSMSDLRNLVQLEGIYNG